MYYDATLLCLEIGSRGFVSQGSKARLRKLLSVFDRPVKLIKVRHIIIFPATISPFAFFSAKNEASRDGQIGYVVRVGARGGN